MVSMKYRVFLRMHLLPFSLAPDFPDCKCILWVNMQYTGRGHFTKKVSIFAWFATSNIVCYEFMSAMYWRNYIWEIDICFFIEAIASASDLFLYI